MRKFEEWWNDLLPYEKIFHILELALICGMLITLYFLELDHDVLWILAWLVGLNNVCTAVILWRNRPFSACVNIVFAFMFAVLAAYGTIHYFD